MSINFSSPGDFLSASGNLNGSDSSKILIRSEFSEVLKEIICNLLAGQGLKLPNLQICISVNLNGLLNTTFLSNALKAAAGLLAGALNKFMQHLNIENVLSRINNAISEIISIANMINFCATPITPAGNGVPNILEDSMQSFLGKGLELLNKIGTIPDAKIGGCMDFGENEFNLDLFDSGILRDISVNWDDIRNGTWTGESGIIRRIKDVVNEIEELIDKENNVSGVEAPGGSSFLEDPLELNTGIGVVHNPDSAGIQGNTRIASILKTQFDKLAGYPVTDIHGTVHENIFELFLDERMLNILRQRDIPKQNVFDEIPIFNYCGEIVGYKREYKEKAEDRSIGYEPQDIDQPGFKSNNMNTSNRQAASAFIQASDSSSGIIPPRVAETEILTEGNLPRLLSFSTNQTIDLGKGRLYSVKALGKNIAINQFGVLLFDFMAFNNNGTIQIDAVSKKATERRFGIAEDGNWDLIIQSTDMQVEFFIIGTANQPIEWKIELTWQEV